MKNKNQKHIEPKQGAAVACTDWLGDGGSQSQPVNEVVPGAGILVSNPGVVVKSRDLATLAKSPNEKGL